MKRRRDTGEYNKGSTVIPVPFLWSYREVWEKDFDGHEKSRTEVREEKKQRQRLIRVGGVQRKVRLVEVVSVRQSVINRLSFINNNQFR